MTLLFVYGTLRPAARRRMARRLLREARPAGPATMPNGRLFRVRHYPGLVAHGGRSVCGDLLRRRRPATTLAWLDDYEGCGSGSPQPHPYARGQITVLHSGRRVRAVGYAWVAPAAGLRLIGSGDWLRR